MNARTPLERLRRASLLLIVVAAGCDSPGEGGGVATDATTAMDSAAATSATDGTGATGVPNTADVAADIAAEVAVETTDAAAAETASAAHPDIGCHTDGDCGQGEVCCTNANAYLSECIAADDCGGGAHDACVTDLQCQARRPGEWTTCCHDRGSRNYCAPTIDTCQPLVACDDASDCAGNGSEVCCSPHRYYGASFCTSEFFANPSTDCPAR